MTDWILQCNPRVWDVYDWWENSNEPLASWTIARHLNDIRRGDRFAFWIGGSQAGVYATGTFTGQITQGHVDPKYWKRPPRGLEWFAYLQVRQYLFDRPIRKFDLMQDKDFANALIIRMPGGANPFRLTPKEWRAIERRAGSSVRPRPTGSTVRVTSRSLGSVKEQSTVVSAGAERTRTYREHQLVKRYETFLGRPLEVRTALLPSGEILVIDAFDPVDDLLIEAKVTSSRQDIRMAIGQLLDYRRHLAPAGKIAVLLPNRPSKDLLDLLRSLQIGVIYETATRGRFRKV
jgi:hypothetical protein